MTLMSSLCHSCYPGVEASALDHLANTGAVLLGVVSSCAHLCHFSGNKAPCSLPYQSVDVSCFEGCCMHTQISSKSCKETVAFLQVVSIDKLINISAPIGEPLSGGVGHKSCPAAPLVGNTVPPVISGNSRG